MISLWFLFHCIQVQVFFKVFDKILVNWQSQCFCFVLLYLIYWRDNHYLTAASFSKFQTSILHTKWTSLSFWFFFFIQDMRWNSSPWQLDRQADGRTIFFGETERIFLGMDRMEWTFIEEYTFEIFYFENFKGYIIYQF